jgi:hypothetical protein
VKQKEKSEHAFLIVMREVKMFRCCAPTESNPMLPTGDPDMVRNFMVSATLNEPLDPHHMH